MNFSLFSGVHPCVIPDLHTVHVPTCNVRFFSHFVNQDKYLIAQLHCTVCKFQFIKWKQSELLTVFFMVNLNIVDVVKYDIYAVAESKKLFFKKAWPCNIELCIQLLSG